MKNKILVIFLIALIFSILIHKITISSKINILILGDKYFLNSNFKTYDTFLKDKYYNVNNLLTEENDTYKNIEDKIKSNYSIKIKNKKMYLSQEISKANYIIISANHKQYNEKCNKSKKITNYYINKTNTEINSLIYIINKISSSKIIIMDNSCSNNDANYTHIKLKQDINNTKSKLSLKDNYFIFTKLVNKIEEKN